MHQYMRKAGPKIGVYPQGYAILISGSERNIGDGTEGKQVKLPLVTLASHTGVLVTVTLGCSASDPALLTYLRDQWKNVQGLGPLPPI